MGIRDDVTDIKANYIKFDWISEDNRLINRAKELAELFLLNYQRKPKANFANAFNLLLTSFDVQGAYSGWAVMIPVNNNLYYGFTRRNNTYQPELLRCINWLIKEDYLVKERGQTAEIIEKKLTYFPTAYRVASKLSEHRLSDPKLIKRNPLADYVQLRRDSDTGKVAVSLSEANKAGYESMIEDTNRTLLAYEKLMANIEVTLGTKPVISAQTNLTRIFSKGSFDKGGRFYSPIQNLKKEARQYLRFNGEPTVEVDFKGMHPSILYNKEDATLEGDPYEIEGFDRNKVKTAFNIMLNREGSKGRISAASSIAYNLDIDQAGAIELENAILKKHEQIKHYFNTGYGLELQKKDSELVLELLKIFIRDNKPIITIHDSAIVSVKDWDVIVLSMHDCYQRLFNLNAQTPLMDTKYNHLSDELIELIKLIDDDDFIKYADSFDKIIAKEKVSEVPAKYNINVYTDEEEL